MWEAYVEFINLGIMTIKLLPTIIIISVIMALTWLVGGE